MKIEALENMSDDMDDAAIAEKAQSVYGISKNIGR